MWTQLANWLVQDGEIPELQPGARLRQVALRAVCWSIGESAQVEGVRELTANTAESEPPGRYVVTGRVERANEPNKVLLQVGSIQLSAEPATFHRVGDDGGLEAYSPAFRIPAVGSQVSVECALEVMAAYEAMDLVWGLQYPDIRRDWKVEAIKIVHRAYLPTGRDREWALGEVTSVLDLDHMQAWADEREDAQARYLLDLRPAG
jgi:hypothetical protein